MKFKHGDEVRYKVHGVGVVTGILLDRAPGSGTWWVHTDDPRVYDLVRVHQSGRDAGRVEHWSTRDAQGRALPRGTRSAETA